MEDLQMNKLKVYTASKLHRHTVWTKLRKDPDWDFVHFTASWIDDPHIQTEMAGQVVGPQIMEENWIKNQDDVEKSNFLLVYSGGDVLRGALIETGIAIACGVPVVAVAVSAENSWVFHPLVTRIPTLREAREFLLGEYGKRNHQ